MIETFTCEDYNLHLTLYPSFTLCLFKRVDSNCFIKCFGLYKGLKFYTDNSRFFVEYPGNISHEYIMFLSGLWFDPYRFYHILPRSIHDLIYPLIEVYGGVRISIAPFDRKYVFISTFLSRRTSYYGNVLRWCNKLFEIIDDGLNISYDNVRNIGGSYQLLQLPDAYSRYMSEVYSDELSLRPIDVKRKLLSIGFVGPKVANAYLLFTRRSSWVTPCDVHYRRFIRRLNLFDGKDLVYPVKSLCIRFYGECKNCRLAENCMEYQSILKFGFLSGWVQTISYIHDTLYCMKNKCRECPFRSVCHLTS